MKENISEEQLVKEVVIKPIVNYEKNQNKKNNFGLLLLLPIFIVSIATAYYLGTLSSKREMSYINQTSDEVIELEIDLMESIESIFEDFNVLPVKKIDNYSMWWVSEDGFSILNQDVVAVVTGVDCSKDNYENSKEKVEEMKISFSSQIDELLYQRGFKINDDNTSVSYDDDSFYDYIRGYEKDDKKCLLTINSDCAGYSSEDVNYAVEFSCTNNFEVNYQTQFPILEDLQLFDQVITINKETNDFLLLAVNGRRSGYALIAKKINGKWVKVHAGHEGPTCDVVENYEIPNEIISSCWDLELNKTLNNTIGL